MTRASTLIASLTDEPVSTSDLYERIGYPALVELGLIPYDAFRGELAALAAEELEQHLRQCPGCFENCKALDGQGGTLANHAAQAAARPHGPPCENAVNAAELIERIRKLTQPVGPQTPNANLEQTITDLGVGGLPPFSSVVRRSVLTVLFLDRSSSFNKNIEQSSCVSVDFESTTVIPKAQLSSFLHNGRSPERRFRFVRDRS